MTAPVVTRRRAITKAPKEVASPYDVLHPYQRRWLADEARFKMWLKSRQIGGSLAGAFEMAEECLAVPRTTWIILSAKEELAAEYLRRVEAASDILMEAARVQERGYVTGEIFGEEKDYGDVKALRVQYNNASRVIALASNPRSARSFTGNVELDEFAHHVDNRKIYAAVFPMVTRRNLKLRIRSTPNGRFDMFAELWKGANDFSKHMTTLYDAVKDGLEIDVELIKRNFANDKMFRQEYLCEFIDDVDEDALIRIEWVENCMRRDAVAEWRDGFTCAHGDFGYTSDGDESTFTLRRGNRVIQRVFKGNPSETTQWFLQQFRNPDPADTNFRIHPNQISGDADGGGAIIIDNLRNANWPIRALYNKAFPKGNQFANRASQTWHTAALVLQRREVILEHDPVLIEELCTRTLKSNEVGQMQIESKKNLERSPGRAEGVCEVLSANPNFVVGTVGQSVPVMQLNKEFVDVEVSEAQTQRRIPGAWAGV